MHQQQLGEHKQEQSEIHWRRRKEHRILSRPWKTQAAANTITSLKTDNDNAITSQAILLHEQVRFYSNLYQEDKDLQNTSDTYITDIFGQDGLLPTLTEQEQNLCEGKLQENEVVQVVKLMKNGSAPGCDGITTEFDKAFWTNINS